MAVRQHGQAVPAAAIAAGEITSTMLAAGAVTLPKVAAGIMTPAKWAASPFVSKAVVGRSGAGACTATGLVVGQRIVAVFGAPTAGGALVEASASFEATVTVNDQLQQSSVSNLSANTYIVIVMAAAS